MSAGSTPPRRDIGLDASDGTFTTELASRPSSNQIDRFAVFSPNLHPSPRAHLTVVPQPHPPVSHGGHLWSEPYNTIRIGSSFQITEIMSCPVLPRTSRVTELDPAPTSPPHESRVTVVTDGCKYTGGGVSFTENSKKGPSGTEHTTRLPRSAGYPPSGWVGSQGHDLPDQNGIRYSLRTLEDGLCECTWKDEFGSNCGFVSRINSVKKHTRRVHLRLRLDFSNVFVLRPFMDTIPADRISVCSAVAVSSLSVASTKTLGKRERSFTSDPTTTSL